MDRLLHLLLGEPPQPAPVADVTAWWRRHAVLTSGLQLPVERAVAGGFFADRLGYAFAAGYKEALRQLVPELGDTPAALCATESGGAHPRAIKASLRPAAAGYLLSGDKTWVTLGTHAAVLLVVASEGADEQGRNRLALCRIPAARPGVTLAEQPPIPFAPEIPHAALHLREVAVSADERLPGDGYERYLKPFRTVEDLHVHAALLGWLLQIARRAGWPRALQEELLLLIAAARTLCASAPADPAIHLSLAGLLGACRRLLTEAAPHWQQVDRATAALWERDRPLLDVAGKARALRQAAAWEQLGGSPQ